MTKATIAGSDRESAKVRRSIFSSLRLIRPQAWMLVLLSALLQVASFPVAGPMPYWRSVLAWFAIAPFLVALFLPGRGGSAITPVSAALLGYCCGVLWYAGDCYWIYQTMYLYGGLPKPVSLLILLLFALYLGLYHGFFAYAIARIQRTGASLAQVLLLSPFAWVAFELARARITGFPWDVLGNSQVDNLFVTRLAPLAGVMAISFVVAAANALFALAFLLKRRTGSIAAAAGLTVLFVLVFEGAPRTKAFTQDRPWAVLMQDNLSVGVMARTGQPQSAAEELDAFSRMSLDPGLSNREFTLPHGTQPTLVVWPEAPSHFRSDDLNLQQRLGELARASGGAVIAGDIGVVFDPAAPKGYYEYDSASMFDREGAARGRYDKIHLVPWGEYVPFKHVFAFAEKLTEGVGDMDPGHDRTVLRTGGHAYGVFICYESIFGDEVREFVQNGAEVLVNISDDGWYGDTGAPWQHLNMARMRAIENDRYLVRSTNTGITTVVDPQGRIGSEAPRHVREAFAFPFGYETRQTFYTRYGDWFACLCALVTVAGVGFSFARRVN